MAIRPSAARREGGLTLLRESEGYSARDPPRRDEEAGRDASSGSAAPTSVALTVLISALAGDGEGPT